MYPDDLLCITQKKVKGSTFTKFASKDPQIKNKNKRFSFIGLKSG